MKAAALCRFVTGACGSANRGRTVRFLRVEEIVVTQTSSPIHFAPAGYRRFIYPLLGFLLALASSSGLWFAGLLALLAFLVGARADLLAATSVTDGLTRLSNRRYFDRRLAEELNRAARYRQAMSLLFIDVDELKRLNDRAGHLTGDRALQIISDAIRKTCRGADVAARYGGDEFVVLAPSTTAVEARQLAYRLLDCVRALFPRRSAGWLTIV